jgi:hypothetical protein
MATAIVEFSDAFSVTPDNSNALPHAGVIGLYVGGTGDVKIDTPHTTGITFKAVPVGTVLHVPIAKVYATGTTATNLVALLGR